MNDWTEERIREIEGKNGSPVEITETMIELLKKGLVYPPLRDGEIAWAATDSN